MRAVEEAVLEHVGRPSHEPQDDPSLAVAGTRGGASSARLDLASSDRSRLGGRQPRRLGQVGTRISRSGREAA